MEPKFIELTEYLRSNDDFKIYLKISEISGFVNHGNATRIYFNDHSIEVTESEETIKKLIGIK